VLLSKGYGSANLEWNIPNTPSTKFRLGSVTKQFTAVAVLMLEERGKLKLTDTVKQHMPNAPAAWDNITIHHLLTHSAGLPNFTSMPEYGQWQLSGTSPEKTVSRFRDKPLDFAPGEKFSYSNSGYLLLGYLVEKISAKSYTEFVTENLFEPLGMKNSGYDSNEKVIERRAAGYSPSADGTRNAGYVHMSIPHAAGALYSTTEDLLKWQRGLYGGKLISAASLKKMTTPFKSGYALGIRVSEPGGRLRYAHGGGIQGFNTSLVYFPDSKITVVALANLNGQAPDQLTGDLGRIAHGDAIKLSSERQEIKVAKEALAALVGTYQMEGAPIKMMITLDGEQLMTQLSGQPRFPLFAEGPDKFFLKVVDAQVEFANGDAVLHQGGRTTIAKRISDKVEQRKAIPVSAEILASYTGKYQGGPLTIHVTFENGRLMTQVPGQTKFELFAESTTKFFLTAVDAQFEFHRPAGAPAASGLVLHQGPNVVKAERVE